MFGDIQKLKEQLTRLRAVKDEVINELRALKVATAPVGAMSSLAASTSKDGGQLGPVDQLEMSNLRAELERQKKDEENLKKQLEDAKAELTKLQRLYVFSFCFYLFFYFFLFYCIVLCLFSILRINSSPQHSVLISRNCRKKTPNWKWPRIPWRKKTPRCV